MADNNNIFYKIEVHGEEGIATIRNMKGQFVQTKVPVTQLNEELAKMNGTMSLTTSEAGRQMAKFKRLRSGVQINSKEYQNLTNSMRAYQKQIDMSTRATGSASSAAMELGRVVSDMPYGIRGVANNLSQFASQMAYSAKSTGGLKFAIKDLFRALSGPLGVLLAIQAVIAALDFFAGGQSKSKEATDENTKSIKKQITPLKKLLNLYSSLKKVLFTSKDNEAINAFNNNFLSLDETVKVLTRNFSEFKNAYDKLSKDDKKNKQSVEALVKGYGELLELRELEEKQVSRMSVLRRDVDKKGRTISRNGLTFLRAEAKELDSLETSYIKTQKRLIKLEDFFSKLKNGDDKGETKLLEIDDFDKQTEDYLDKIASVSQKQELLNAELNSDKVKIQERYHLEALEAKNIENKAKFKQQADAYRLEYQAFLDQQVRTTPMTKSEAKGLLNDFDEDIKAQQKASEDNFNVLIKKTKDFYFDKFFIALQGEQKIQKSKSESQTKELEDLAFYLEKYTELMGGIGDFLQAESDRELAIEQNKTNVLNKELNDRLINENLSESQRKSIQDQILKNDEALRVKQEVIKKKAFNTQKAFNISAALVDTYAAASSAYRNTLASPANILDPTVGLIRAKVNAGIAMAGGLLQVAAIARQKYQSSSAATPINTGGGGGGSATERAEPSFNIVGGSRENQLLTAIQSQFDKPLKAYVVSTEVTDQQELDGIIVNQAGL